MIIRFHKFSLIKLGRKALFVLSLPGEWEQKRRRTLAIGEWKEENWCETKETRRDETRRDWRSMIRGLNRCCHRLLTPFMARYTHTQAHLYAILDHAEL
jgi:hypothetical protein